MQQVLEYYNSRAKYLRGCLFYFFGKLLSSIFKENKNIDMQLT